MFRYFFLIIFIVFPSCNNNESLSNVEFKINPASPTVFTADTIETKKTIIDGVRTIETFDIPGPWMSIGFDIINKSKIAVTIIAVTFYISLPNEEIKTQSITNYNANGEALSFFAILRPENDVNCDGIVSNSEAKLINPVLDKDCFMDETNPSFNGLRFKLYDLLSNAEDKSAYLGASYPVKAHFEGWTGTFEKPEKNFFKEIFFIGKSSF